MNYSNYLGVNEWLFICGWAMVGFLEDSMSALSATSLRFLESWC